MILAVVETFLEGVLVGMVLGAAAFGLGVWRAAQRELKKRPGE